VTVDAPDEQGIPETGPPDVSVEDIGITCMDDCSPGDSKCQSAGIASCTMGADGCFVWGMPAPCGAGESCVQMGGMPACVPVPPPRAIAPLATATVTSQSPTFHWILATGTDGAQVDVCRDRACTTPVTSFLATGAKGAPAMALSSGVYYWRLHGALNGIVGSGTSAVWEFFVGARTAPVDASWGSFVDVNGDGFADVVIGAPNVNSLTGLVEVYLGSANGLSTNFTTLKGGSGAFPEFGSSVASAGDVNGDGFGDVIIGSPSQTAAAAYLYLGSENGLAAMPTTINGGLFFGQSVSGAGDVNGDGYADVLISGTSGGRSPLVANLYLGSASGLSVPPMAISNGGLDSMGSAGDLNGDGYADIVLGNFDANNANGEVSVYLGGPQGPASPVTIPGPVMYGAFGYSVAAADVNGDGYADLAVGAPGETSTFSVYLGSAAGVKMMPSTFPDPLHMSGTISYPTDPDFGACVRGAGDVNGDGYGDVVVGASGVGVAYVYLGGPGGLAATPAQLRVAGSSQFGLSLSGAGDVNGDGFGDLLVGAPSTSLGMGTAYLYFGTKGGLTGAPTVLTGPMVSGPVGFGFSLASVGWKKFIGG
jgi:hypothetical protein